MKFVSRSAFALALLILSTGLLAVGAQAADPAHTSLPRNLSIVISKVPGKSISTFVTTITPAINLTRTTYGSNGRGGAPNPGSFHLLYLIDQPAPTIGETAVGNGLEILSDRWAVTRRGDSLGIGPVQILENDGTHAITPVIVSDDNVIRAIGRSLSFDVARRPIASGSAHGPHTPETGAIVHFVDVWMALMVIAAALLTWNSVRRTAGTMLALDRAHAFRLVGGGGEYQLRPVSGHVAGTARELEARINVSTSTTTSIPGSSNPYYTPSGSTTTSTSVSSRTVTHDRFFVVDRAGRETAVHLVDWDIAVRDGQFVSMVWGTREGGGDGDGGWVLLRNHSTDRMNWKRAFFKHAAETPSESRVLGCLLWLFGWPLFFVPLIARWIEAKHTEQVLARFLPGGLDPLVRAMDEAAESVKGP